MSQFDLSTISASDSGNTLVSALDSFSAAFLSNNSGAARPSYAVEGTKWTKIVSATLREVYYYDGNTDFLLFTYNPVANTFVIDSDTLNGYADYARTIVNSSDPGAVGAYNYWIDTTAGLIKQRNAANSGWIIIGKSNVNGLLLTGSVNPNGVETGSYEGQQYYDTTNDLLWLYSGSGTVWYSIGGIKSGSLPTNYHDVRIDYTDTNTITVLAGSRVRSSDDTTDIIFSTDRTCVLNASGANGLDTGSEAANTWYYLYAIYNPTTLTSALLFSTVNEVVTGSITLPAGYTKKRQLKFAVRNNASSNIVEFHYSENGCIFLGYYNDPGTPSYTSAVLTGGTATSFTDVSCASFIPTVSRKAMLGVFSAVGTTRVRMKGETHNGRAVGSSYVGGANNGDFSIELPLDSSQIFQYIRNAGSTTIWVNGFYVTEVK